MFGSVKRIQKLDKTHKTIERQSQVLRLRLPANLSKSVFANMQRKNSVITNDGCD
jgi:hypothetical protein